MSQPKKKEAMLRLFASPLGLVTKALESVGIDRRTHYRWMKEDEEYSQAVRDVESVSRSRSQSKLHKLIESGNPVAIIFYLKTKGKARGYVQRSKSNPQPQIEWR